MQQSAAIHLKLPHDNNHGNILGNVVKLKHFVEYTIYVKEIHTRPQWPNDASVKNGKLKRSHCENKSGNTHNCLI